MNGSVTANIYPKKGLHQGNLVSPYLFLLCEEDFSSLHRYAKRLDIIQDVKATHLKPVLHLFFTHNAFIFCDASVIQCQELKMILSMYESTIIQHANFDKSMVSF